MRVNIDEIKEAGLERAWDLSREAVDEVVGGNGAGYRARGSLHVASRLRKLHGRVLLEARAEAPLTASCGRCLAAVELDVPLEFTMTFVPAGPAAGEGQRPHDAGLVAGTFDAGAVDEEQYQGKVIDLDPVVREQLLLALPVYPVCDEACKGLCPVCGTNLNERPCSCDPHVPDPRWAALKKLKDQT